jgi:hypothetical protein
LGVTHGCPALFLLTGTLRSVTIDLSRDLITDAASEMLMGSRAVNEPSAK